MVIGIDLGTTNSLACVYRNGHTELIPNSLGEYMTKSAVSVLEDGSVLTGSAARERLLLHPTQTAVSFKRFMGTDHEILLGDRVFLPHELSALILRQLYEEARAYLGQEIEEAVISVPAYFDDNQRNATKLAAQLAGIPVKRLINEPSAAALRYNLGVTYGDSRLMILDFGGGTLDVSIVECFENIIEIVAIAGDNRLGGDDIDRAIAEYFCRVHSLNFEALPVKQREALLYQAEAAKKALSREPEEAAGSSQGAGPGLSQEPESAAGLFQGAGPGLSQGQETAAGSSQGAVPGFSQEPEAESTFSREMSEIPFSRKGTYGENGKYRLPRLCLTLDRPYEMELSRKLLREICQPYLERIKSVIIRAVRDSHLTPDKLDDVVLVGGSARLAVLGDYLEELMGRRPVVAGNPDYMVAEGAGICAGIKSRREELRDMVMTDVCPFSLGIAVCNDVKDQNPHMATMIARSSMLPVSRSETFYTLSDNQTHIRLRIYQGEGYYASENRQLGELTVRVPAGPAGKHSVFVTFAYDINGILHVDAESSGGDRRETVIMNPHVQLSEEEVQEKVAELKKLRYVASGSEEDHLLMAKAERLYEELLGSEREEVARILDAYRYAIREGSPIELKKVRGYARTRLNALERAWDSVFGVR